MTVRLHQLRYFDAVARLGSFTRAAEDCHVSQPSLSTQVRALEQNLGTVLVNRTRGDISLTDTGRALLPFARRILADVDTARQHVQEVAGLARGRLRIGATPSLAGALLPETLRRIHDAHPAIELHVEEGGSRDLVRQLADGALDAALIVLPLHSGDPALTCTPILREPLVVAASQRARKQIGATTTLAALAEHPLAVFRPGYEIRDTTSDAFRDADLQPNIAIEGGEMHTVLSFVRADLGLAIVPRIVLEQHPGLAAVRLTEPSLSRTIALARRSDLQPTAAATAFEAVLHHQLADMRESRTIGKDVEFLPTTSGP